MMEDVANEINDLFLLCRLCIVGDGKFAIVPKTKIHTSIKEIFGVKIDPYDGLPQLLCVQCKEKLLEIQNIRATFTTNQEILAALKTNFAQNTENQVIKTEPPDELDETACETDAQDTNSPAEAEAESTETAAIHKQASTNNQTQSEKTNETKNTDTTIKTESNVEDSSEPISELVHPETDDLEYLYHCRLCNDNFNSVFKLRSHTKCHENLIQIQRRYTPYSCSVRIPRMKEYSTANKGNDDYQFSHPLFFIRKRNIQELTEKDNADPHTNADTDSCGDVGFTSNNIMQATRDATPKDCSNLTHNTEVTDIMDYEDAPQTEKDATKENEIKTETDTTSIFKPTIQYDPWSNPTSSNFGSILREACDVLDDDQDMESKPYSFDLINHEKISEIIQRRISKYYLAEKETELELVQNVLINLCKRQIRLSWKESKLCPEIFFKSLDKTSIRPSNLEEFELVPEPPKPASRKTGPKITEEPFKQIDVENNMEGIGSVQNSSGKIVLNNRSENTTLNVSVMEKLSSMSDVRTAELSSANANNSGNAGTEFTVNIENKIPNKTHSLFAANAESQFDTSAENHIDSNEESQFHGNAESQFDANAESPFDANAESLFDANADSQFDTDADSQFAANPDGPVDLNGNSNTDNTAFNTNNTDNNVLPSESDPVVTNNNSENLSSNSTSAMMPIIVSTSTLEPSTAATESTSVYIDLEDNEHTVNSDHFSEPVTPIMFFHYVLEKEGFFLSFEKQSPQAATLVCYKKNVDGIGDFVLTISIDDIIFYMEICQGKKTIDLTKETLVTQWILLSSINQPKVETIMLNYAKRFSIDLDKIEKFVKITRSISGTVQGDSVWMEAPNQFFF